MDAILQALAHYLRLNARYAFALAAAAPSLWLLVKAGIVARDPTEITIAYAAAFGLFVCLTFPVEWIARGLVAFSRRWAAAAKARRTALSNLGVQISREEFEALEWIHHKGLSRVRAGHQYHVIDTLERLGILQVEDFMLPPGDRIFVVPTYVRRALLKQLGPRDASKCAQRPPWYRERRY